MMTINIDRLAKILILFGVFAWAPYFILIGLGFAPPVFVFLFIHLSGIIPGVLLKQRKRIRNTAKIIGL